MRLRRRIFANTKASAAIEGALIAPFLIIFSLAALDAGNLMLTIHRVETGLASGAALLERADAPLAFASAAKNFAVSGRTVAGGALTVPGWSADQVQVTMRSVDNSSGALRGGETIKVVRLETEFPYQGLGLLRMAGVGSLMIRASHEERVFGGGA